MGGPRRESPKARERKSRSTEERRNRDGVAAERA